MRRRKSGSYVTHPRAQLAALEIRDIKLEVESLGLPYHYKLAARARRRSSSEDRQRLGLEVTTPVLDVRCTHFAGNRPFCIETRLINLAAVPDAAAETFEKEAAEQDSLECGGAYNPGHFCRQYDCRFSRDCHWNGVSCNRQAHVEQW